MQSGHVEGILAKENVRRQHQGSIPEFFLGPPAQKPGFFSAENGRRGAGVVFGGRDRGHET